MCRREGITRQSKVRKMKIVAQIDTRSKHSSLRGQSGYMRLVASECRRTRVSDKASESLTREQLLNATPKEVARE